MEPSDVSDVDGAEPSDAGEPSDANGLLPHPGVTCDRSGMNPIVGIRYHLRGRDFDLCEAEYQKLSDDDKAHLRAVAAAVGRSLDGIAADTAAAAEAKPGAPARAGPQPSPMRSTTRPGARRARRSSIARA